VKPETVRLAKPTTNTSACFDFNGTEAFDNTRPRFCTYATFFEVDAQRRFAHKQMEDIDVLFVFGAAQAYMLNAQLGQDKMKKSSALGGIPRKGYAYESKHESLNCDDVLEAINLIFLLDAAGNLGCKGRHLKCFGCKEVIALSLPDGVDLRALTDAYKSNWDTFCADGEMVKIDRLMKGKAGNTGLELKAALAAPKIRQKRFAPY
jgi:hypothetical protein